MSRRDFRCALSGVSLLDAEVAAVLIQKIGGQWRPAALPLFGVYGGLGVPEDVADGPNADLILGGFQKAQAEGTLEIDFDKMDLTARDLDHIETVLSVIACSQIEELDAVRSAEGPLGFALLSAHVAAAVMEAEPELDLELGVEGLPSAVFDSGFSHALYSPLARLPHRLRCKFGLSLVGLAALDQQMDARGQSWQPPGSGVALDESQPALWLAEAMMNFADSASLIEALEDYSAPADEPA